MALDLSWPVRMPLLLFCTPFEARGLSAASAAGHDMPAAKPAVHSAICHGLLSRRVRRISTRGRASYLLSSCEL